MCGLIFQPGNRVYHDSGGANWTSASQRQSKLTHWTVKTDVHLSTLDKETGRQVSFSALVVAYITSSLPVSFCGLSRAQLTSYGPLDVSSKLVRSCTFPAGLLAHITVYSEPGMLTLIHHPSPSIS